MLIDCPHCGPRSHAEFAPGGDATVTRPPIAPNAPDPQDGWSPAWQAYVYERDNPAGLRAEYWQHTGGCRLWLRVERDVRDHRILSVRPAP